MSDGRNDSEGGRTFFFLAVVILGGLLFAAGVMVGRTMAPVEQASDSNPLARIDARDRKSIAALDSELVYPKALDGAQADRPPLKKTKPKDKPAPKTPAPKLTPVDGGSSSAARDADPELKVEPKPETGAYCLQVASFREQSQAEQLVDKLRSKGLRHVRFVSGEVPGKGTYYRVRVGRFADKTSAEKYDSRNELNALIILGEE